MKRNAIALAFPGLCFLPVARKMAATEARTGCPGQLRGGSPSGKDLDLCLATNGLGPLVITHPHKARVPQIPSTGPLDKADLVNQLGAGEVGR